MPHHCHIWCDSLDVPSRILVSTNQMARMFLINSNEKLNQLYINSDHAQIRSEPKHLKAAGSIQSSVSFTNPVQRPLNMLQAHGRPPVDISRFDRCQLRHAAGACHDLDAHIPHVQKHILNSSSYYSTPSSNFRTSSILRLLNNSFLAIKSDLLIIPE